MPFFYYVSITTLCLYLPKFGIQMMTPFANKYGLYDFIKRVNEALMAVNLLALLVGFESHMLWGLLVVIQMVLFASWGFYGLIMAYPIASRIPPSLGLYAQGCWGAWPAF